MLGITVLGITVLGITVLGITVLGITVLGITVLGITVGLFDEYGPAQRLYGRRGYIPDGPGACRDQRPLGKGMQVIMDDDLIMWLTKDLASLRLNTPLSA